MEIFALRRHVRRSLLDFVNTPFPPLEPPLSDMLYQTRFGDMRRLSELIAHAFYEIFGTRTIESADVLRRDLGLRDSGEAEIVFQEIAEDDRTIDVDRFVHFVRRHLTKVSDAHNFVDPMLDIFVYVHRPSYRTVVDIDRETPIVIDGPDCCAHAGCVVT